MFPRKWKKGPPVVPPGAMTTVSRSASAVLPTDEQLQACANTAASSSVGGASSSSAPRTATAPPHIASNSVPELSRQILSFLSSVASRNQNAKETLKGIAEKNATLIQSVLSFVETLSQKSDFSIDQAVLSL